MAINGLIQCTSFSLHIVHYAVDSTANCSLTSILPDSPMYNGTLPYQDSSRESVNGTVTTVWAGQLRNRGSNPDNNNTL